MGGKVLSEEVSNLVGATASIEEDSTISPPITHTPPDPPPEPPPNEEESQITEGLSTCKLIKLNIKNMFSTKMVVYSYNPATLTHSYVANEGYLFNLITEGKELIWKPKVDKFANGITVKEECDGRRSYKVYIATDVCTDYKSQPIEGCKIKVPLSHQLATVDIKNLSSTCELVYNYNPSDDSHMFTANPGYLINKVTKRDTVLWDAEDYNNVYSNRVFVGFNESLEPIFRVYFPGEPPKLSVPVPPKPLEPDLTKPTLITLDVKIKEPTNEILYEYDKRNQTHTFTPLPGFAIDRVVKGRNQMWKCEDGVYPEKVLIILDQGGDQVLRFQFPEPVKQVPLRQPEPRLELPPHSSHKREHLLVETEYDQRVPVDLNVQIDQGTKFFTYDDRTSVSIFIANDDYVFGKIKDVDYVGNGENEITVWDPKNSGEHSYRVEYDTIDYFITVYLVNGSKKEFKKVNRKWVDHTHSRPSEIVAISLNIKHRTSSGYFEYYRSGNVETYIPIEGYLFRLVKSLTGLTFFGSDVVIWSTNEPENYSDKVEIIDKHTVVIYSVRGKVWEYKKGANNKWLLEKEYTVDRDKSVFCEFVDLDINDLPVAGNVQLALSMSLFSYHMDCYTYRTNTGYRFYRVRDGDMIIWETLYDRTSANKVEYCKHFSSSLQRLYITLVDGTEKVFEWAGSLPLYKSWKELI
ncbi:phosphoinositide 5-phosphatase [Theileria orientalis]|uniref:Phosphoinositide 5-phosphatase n=1 Tax=Theileria orientalis TaxID=68886 RepID=A0A976QRN4_THEOR|nr:phosphoinositide 5-phosphatase [Theileria orientalis]